MPNWRDFEKSQHREPDWSPLLRLTIHKGVSRAPAKQDASGLGLEVKGLGFGIQLFRVYGLVWVYIYVFIYRYIWNASLFLGGWGGGKCNDVFKKTGGWCVPNL